MVLGADEARRGREGLVEARPGCVLYSRLKD